MVTRDDYSGEIVEACRGVLVELISLLGRNSEYMVLVGGWVPYFQFRDRGGGHVGSLDVDLSLDFNRIPNDDYSTFLERLGERGYEQDDRNPASFWRTVTLDDGREVRIKVDFVAGEYGGRGRKHRHQKAQDLLARKARGCDIVFENFFTVEVEGRLPDGELRSERVNVAGVVPFLVMKGMALHDRLKEKDAYDVCFVVKNYQGGTHALAFAFKPFASNGLIIEGLSKIRAQCLSVDHFI
ncbi:MAG: hypothetical protein KKE79_08090, partial [Actinobacteria bacterium]|nr:hypothetical protein [Actinomycetota bacterium]